MALDQVETQTNQTETSKKFPYILRYREGSDPINITSYPKSTEGPRNTLVAEPKYYNPRFARQLDINTTIETITPDGEQHYYNVVSAPERGAIKGGIYAIEIEKPINLEKLRSAGNVVQPDVLYLTTTKVTL